nr:cobyric acid synthase [Gemmatimonadaceae bacterium]
MTTTPDATPAGKVLLVVGTASHAGKSTMVAGLCRHFANRGLRVAPFKAQNMSLNAAATLDGGEIGRAQMLQARAARATASVHMNPVLLKPVSEQRSQVVLRGRVLATEEARVYYTRRDALWPVVADSLDTLRREHDLVICEGAGSPVEINLRDRDIVNMEIALHAQAPTLLVGDIERGGVFAALHGTMLLLAPAERALVVGTIVNKFRGDATLFEPGPRLLHELTGVPTLGVVPYLRDLALPEEDALGLERTGGDDDAAALDLAVIRLPHLSNFDD